MIKLPLTAAAAAALLAATTAFAEEEAVVNVYNWSDYIDEEILTEFEAETGIKVVYDVFDSNNILETKLLTGSTGYDVVVPSGTFLARQIQGGHLPAARQEQARQYRQYGRDHHGGREPVGPGEQLRHQLHVGHHRLRLQHR